VSSGCEIDQVYENDLMRASLGCSSGCSGSPSDGCIHEKPWCPVAVSRPMMYLTRTADRGGARPRCIPDRGAKPLFRTQPSGWAGSRKARNNTFLRLPAYAASAFSSQGPSIANRSCDRTTGVVLRGNRKFADSPLEGDGFELVVPRGDGASVSRLRRSRYPACGLCDFHPRQK
jgi:hypothetical protein